ncbi:MAG: manganese-dependent inorganic pyrophosphatase [Proteobacteria bacterium]|nr:manganese-dependent inorganic pyrophosphatase [Pseudomonadota bacterium]MBU1716285.1 manganese-dependent inorganic pyrophosphatase [Pseudomonadota bacterium]
MSVYVVGHKSPDTDSVTSAIAYAELKKAMGVDAVPAMQGELNPETTLVLEKFGFAAPVIMTDGAGKKLILVDHSDISQAPDNLDKAEIIEIIDHHKIGDITTNNPILFNAQPVGCTGTVLKQLFEINNVKITKNVAGIMLAAILSDTVLFKSPTTTEADKKACDGLAKIAGISDMAALAMEMFKAKSAVAGVPARDLIFRDYKDFDMKGKKVGCGQLEMVDLSLIDDMRDDLYKTLKEVKEEGGRHTILLMLTDIMKEGTDLMVISDDVSFVEKAFKVKIDGPTVWIDGMMSRKKQTIPPLQSAFGC